MFKRGLIDTWVTIKEETEWGKPKPVRSPRFEVLRCLHAIDARRLQEMMSWLVCFLILSEFGPRRETSSAQAGDIHLIFEFEAPPGIRYPQHAPGIDSFDEKDRISKLAEELKAQQIAELDAGRKDKAELADQILDRQRAAKRVRTTEFTDGEIEAAFKFIDLDHNGYVGAAEIRHVLVCMGELITDEEVDMMIKMVDSDGDGQVSFTEFYNVVTDPDPAHTDFVKMAVRSRRPAVLRRLHAVDARRLQERMSRLVSFLILSCFGPRRDRDAPRRRKRRRTRTRRATRARWTRKRTNGTRR